MSELEEGSGLERRPNYDPTYMKEGYLQKKGQLLKGWKKRWFVCDGRSLSYYISSKDKKPNAVIPLESASVQDGGLSETWHSPRIYLTDGTSGTMYCLSAEEKGVASDWLSVLTKAVARIQEVKHKHRLERNTSVGGTTITPFDEEEGRQKPVSQQHAPPSPARKPMTSEASRSRMQPSSQMSHGSKVPTQPTNIRLENELSSASELLSCLLFNKPSSQHPLHFHFHGAKNGVRVSTATHGATGKQYVRGSVALKTLPSVALRILLDHQKRNEWDLHFPVSTHVATYGGSTDLIHLSGGAPYNLFADPLVATANTALPALGCAALSTLLAGDVVHSACAAVLGGLASSIDWRSLAVPRDLLLLRHVYEASTPHAKRNDRLSCHNVLDAVGMSSVPSAMVILEMSVTNELKPVPTGVVRGHVGTSGWLVEPLDGESTLLTYVTDLNLGGWVPAATTNNVLHDRMTILSAIAEFVHQAKIHGPNLGYIDDDDDDDDTRDAMTAPAHETHVADAGSSVFHPRDYFKLMLQIPTGGVKLTDKEVAKKQNGVLMEVIKSMGTKLLEGKSAVSLSLPVRIFEPRSMLERLVDLYLYAPNYLNRAADATEMLERFKLTMTFAIAGWHHGVGCMKPFNPILGETFEAELADGAQVYGEHTSHHPRLAFSRSWAKSTRFPPSRS
ncbi:hypothetical protein SPRG_01860 [Saprolegnia parasitica CBS 223.65]|uniref:PH domain-containing protein n=1 Tax=Saprolegnia parasitica (strain CBS 223.65) TaxID=695850 RepID=A0A067CUV8_SAPPC|nr:hypothetical protein SPRG_01860 [Saprolegnia parasitica CBS 223.65]KDO33045.1 hypothetical protein SPRG_01860 [Saprolegnia parasitica CBS 223.65]|eukprot:XP_012195816.1 hypothetical protein SPRG_01860 [Saprolegnia parasitica CBS 223.65]